MVAGLAATVGSPFYCAYEAGQAAVDSGYGWVSPLAGVAGFVGGVVAAAPMGLYFCRTAAVDAHASMTQYIQDGKN